MGRLHPRAIEPSGTDGQILTTAGGIAAWADAPAGTGGGVQSVVAGTGIAVDNTDPANPIVSATGGGGGSTTNVLLLDNGATVPTGTASGTVVFEKTAVGAGAATAVPVVLIAAGATVPTGTAVGAIIVEKSA